MKCTTKLTVLSLSSALALSTAAFAGTIEEPVIEEQVFTPAPPPAPVSDWTGFYTGIQLGYADISGDGGIDGSDNSYGFHAGYDYDFGNYVIGAELDYDQMDVDVGGGASVDSVARLKVKGGYDLGNTLIYATAGAARADTSVGDETGPFVGLGVTYKVTEQYTVGAELLEHRFDDLGGVAGNDVDATTLTVRGSFRF